MRTSAPLSLIHLPRTQGARHELFCLSLSSGTSLAFTLCLSFLNYKNGVYVLREGSCSPGRHGSTKLPSASGSEISPEQ